MPKYRAEDADKITHTALMAGMPPMLPLTAIAIGVVTDLGRIEAAICGVAPISRATVVPVIIATQLPIKQMVMIDFQRARIWRSRSYSGERQGPSPPAAADQSRTLLPGKITLRGDPGQQKKWNNHHHRHQQRVEQRNLKGPPVCGREKRRSGLAV